MKIILFAIILSLPGSIYAQYPNGKELLDKIDKNMASESREVSSKMIIHGQRGDRTIESRTIGKGDIKAFTEYLSPARERGTKMLKLEDALWIYSPSTDRTIQIAGHMLRQSVMGSDMSYEDMMDDSKLTDHYNATVSGEEKIDDRDCWVLELIAFDEKVAYFKRIQWIDKQRYIPLKEELYAKSGKLLKKTELTNVVKIENRWYPMRIVFKDELKSGGGTEFIILDVKFNVEVPEYIFSKASLKK